MIKEHNFLKHPKEGLVDAIRTLADKFNKRKLMTPRKKLGENLKVNRGTMPRVKPDFIISILF